MQENQPWKCARLGKHKQFWIQNMYTLDVLPSVQLRWPKPCLISGDFIAIFAYLEVECCPNSASLSHRLSNWMSLTCKQVLPEFHFQFSLVALFLPLHIRGRNSRRSRFGSELTNHWIPWSPCNHACLGGQGWHDPQSEGYFRWIPVLLPGVNQWWSRLWIVHN